MPHMLAQEHMGIVNALQYAGPSLTRDYATLAAALAAIGSSKAMLLLPYEGDGVWTVNTNITFPSNVIVYIAPGVTIAGTGNIVFNAQMLAYSATWYTGSGTQTLNWAPTRIGAIVTRTIGLNTDPVAGTQLHISGDNVLQARIRLEERNANNSALIDFYSSTTQRGSIGLAASQNMTLGLANSASFVVSGGNMGIGMVPTTQLELSTGGAQKSTGTTWSNPSDPRLKQDIHPYTDGLEVIRQVHPIWYTLNGKAGIPRDGQEHIGVLADDLQPVAPYMVGSYRGKLDPEAPNEVETDILTYDGHAMTFALINAVKELTTRLEALEATLHPQQPAA